MKTSKINLLAVLGIWTFTTACFGQMSVIWEQQFNGIAEFGITSVVGGVFEQSPRALETGYNGAYGFGGPANWGFAQSFAVPSDRTLASIQLRLGAGNPPGQGQFSLSVIQFDPVTATAGALLGSVTANASNYPYDLLNVPVSSFDFSGLSIPLRASETYAWTLTPASPSWSGSLSIQAAVAGLYPEGSSYALILVPEPSIVALAGLGAVALMTARRRR